MRHILVILASVAIISVAIFYLRPVPLPPEPEDEARSAWATPLDLEGVPNLFEVTEDLFRGAQPTAVGMRNLEKMGIKTVVNLRLLHSDEDELEGTNLSSIHIEVEAWDADEDEVIEFLKVVSDAANLPAFVHCRHGSDRTGMMCAIYRLVVCGWDREDAIREMTRGDFGYHRIWKDLVAYLGKLDVESLRRAAGVEEVGCPS